MSREARILNCVHMEESLSVEEAKQLSDLVVKFSDIFALDQSELSSTDIVTHVIDTGDSAPVKQHPRRIPFALQSRPNGERDVRSGCRSALQKSVGKPCCAGCQERW